MNLLAFFKQISDGHCFGFLDWIDSYEYYHLVTLREVIDRFELDGLAGGFYLLQDWKQVNFVLILR